MKLELDSAISSENYELAAKLRDKISNLELDVESAVLEANSLFYKAFNDADAKAMSRVWGEGSFVSCTHPESDIIIGREMVMQSWEHLL